MQWQFRSFLTISSTSLLTSHKLNGAMNIGYMLWHRGYGTYVVGIHRLQVAAAEQVSLEEKRLPSNPCCMCCAIERAAHSAMNHLAQTLAASGVQD